MKRILVVVTATGKSHDLEIQPGTTTSEILDQINMSGCTLRKYGEEQPFGNDENVFVRIEDGEKLEAFPQATAGIRSSL